MKGRGWLFWYFFKSVNSKLQVLEEKVLQYKVRPVQCTSRPEVVCCSWVGSRVLVWVSLFAFALVFSLHPYCHCKHKHLFSQSLERLARWGKGVVTELMVDLFPPWSMATFLGWCSVIFSLLAVFLDYSEWSLVWNVKKEP